LQQNQTAYDAPYSLTISKPFLHYRRNSMRRDPAKLPLPFTRKARQPVDPPEVAEIWFAAWPVS